MAEQKKPQEYLNLMLARDVFVDLLSNKEVVDMTMAQFSRDDILVYQGREEGRIEGREEGREEGRIEGVIRTLKKYNESDDTIVRELISEFALAEDEAEEYLDKYNRDISE